MKEIFLCPIIPKAAGKSLHEQSATFFTQLAEAWALFLLNRWIHYVILRVGDPRNAKPKLHNNGTELLPPHLVHLHSSTGDSAKCCDLLPSNMGSAGAVSFGKTPP